MLFLVDSAASQGLDDYQLVCLMFDGRDEHSVSRARKQWKAAKAAECSVTYWQQNDAGGWVKKAG